MHRLGVLVASSVLVAVGVGVVPGASAASSTPAVQKPRPFPVLERDWAPANNGPQPPGTGAMAYDAARHQTVLLVPGRPSQTWVFDGGTRQWSQQAPATSPDLVTAGAAWDPATNSIVVFGTNADPGSCNLAASGETWTWDGATWTRRQPTTAPSECVAPGSIRMAPYIYYKVVLVVTLPGASRAETWKWNGNTWALANRNGPVDAPIVDFSLRTFSFGGTFSNGNHDDFGATRVWRGSSWSTIAAGGGKGDPAPRRGAALTAADGGSPVLFGGATQSSGQLLADTWRWVYGRWMRLPTQHSPPAMAGASFVYDDAHDVGVLLGRGTWLLTAAHAGGGYLMCASDGGVFTFGDAHYYGSTGGMHLNQPIVGIARTPSRKGYWLVARDGGVFTFGDARFYGSTGGMHLNQPIIAIAPTPDGRGYWLVASDGGIFSFGDAPFVGSTAGRHLDQPVVGIATVKDGYGYYLATRDGRVFSFGDVRIQTARATIPLPTVGIARNPVTAGWWVVNRAGTVFAYAVVNFGYAKEPHAPIVAIVASPTTQGYWLFGADGTAHAFGDAHFYGNAPGNLKAPIVAATAT
jgi:hypothetical protein